MGLITLAKLAEYRKYGGDFDWFARLGVPESEILNSAEEWELIRDLMHDCWLVSKNLTSEDFAMIVDSDLRRYCNTDAAIEETKRISEWYYTNFNKGWPKMPAIPPGKIKFIKSK